jgi:hypothetical protein
LYTVPRRLLASWLLERTFGPHDLFNKFTDGSKLVETSSHDNCDAPISVILFTFFQLLRASQVQFLGSQRLKVADKQLIMSAR